MNVFIVLISIIGILEALQNNSFITAMLAMQRNRHITSSQLRPLRLTSFLTIPTSIIDDKIIPELKQIGLTKNETRFNNNFVCESNGNSLDCYKMCVMFANNDFIKDKIHENPLSVRFNDETNKFTLNLHLLCKNGWIKIEEKHLNIEWTHIPSIITSITSCLSVFYLIDMDTQSNLREIKFYNLRQIHFKSLCQSLKKLELSTGSYRIEFVGGIQNLWHNGQYIEEIELNYWIPYDYLDDEWLIDFHQMTNLKQLKFCTPHFEITTSLKQLFLNENPKKDANSTKDTLKIYGYQNPYGNYFERTSFQINKDGLTNI
eukprot:76362_1